MDHPCWSTLGLSPTADVGVIRAAYSTLIKQHRPDEDPEAFKRIHSAYKEALALAKGSPTNAGDHTDRPSPTATASAPPAVELTPAQRETQAALLRRVDRVLDQPLTMQSPSRWSFLTAHPELLDEHFRFALGAAVLEKILDSEKPGRRLKGRVGQAVMGSLSIAFGWRTHGAAYANRLAIDDWPGLEARFQPVPLAIEPQPLGGSYRKELERPRSKSLGMLGKRRLALNAVTSLGRSALMVGAVFLAVIWFIQLLPQPGGPQITTSPRTPAPQPSSEEQLEAALIRYERDLRGAELRVDSRRAVYALSNLGQTHSRLGNLELAQEAYADALTRLRKAPQETEQEAKVLNALGSLSLAMGEFEAALDHHRQAQRIAGRLDDEFQLHVAARGIGAIHLDRGNYPEAIGAWERAVQLAENLRIGPEQAVSLAYLGISLRQAGQLDTARARLTEAEALATKLGSASVLDLVRPELAALYAQSSGAAP